MIFCSILFSFFNYIQILIPELRIIFISVVLLHWYFKSAAVIFVTINQNSTRNTVPFYRRILLFFCQMLEIYFHRFTKTLAPNLVLTIVLKHIVRNLIIVIICHDDFRSCSSCYVGWICKSIWKISWVFCLNLRNLISVALSTGGTLRGNKYVSAWSFVDVCCI